MLKSRKAIGIIGINLFAIASYFLLAILAKAGFAWESSAVTLWPAAGLANALVIAHGWLVLPGLVIGNFLGTACDPTYGCSVKPFMFCVAFAAAAQAALIRSVLIQRKLLKDNLTRFPKLMGFLLWIGPLGNWPAATTFFLYKLFYLGPFVFQDQTLSGTLFWWIGDSLGSLLLLPLLLMLFPLRRPIWVERKPHLIGPLFGLLIGVLSAAFLERLLFERIELSIAFIEPLKDLRLLTTFTWVLVASGMMGLILQTSGKAIEQEKQLVRSRLAGHAAGALIHEIGQPLIRLRVRLERIVRSYELCNEELNDQNNEAFSLEQKKEVEFTLKELDAVVLNTRSIQDLTLAGIRDSEGADIADGINRAARQLRPELDRLDQDLTISIDNQLPKVSAGQIQLQAALRNLLANASNAAGEHGVIRLSAKYSYDQVFIKIEDSGSGFDPLSIPNGKERFKSTTGGLGLGIMIVHRVIIDNGGTIDFGKSEDLGGAKVIVSLSSIVRKS